MYNLSYFYRSIVLALKPLSIFISGYFYSEIYASELAKFYLYTAISTSILSGSIYRTYIKGFYQEASKWRQKIQGNLQLHISLVLVIFYFLILSVSTKFLIIAIMFDFVIHQSYRIFLYQKKMGQWFILNLLSIFIIIVLSGVSLNEMPVIPNYIKYFFYASLGVIIFYILTKTVTKRRIFVFMKNFISINSLYGIQRRVFANMDRLFISFIVKSEDFWLFSLMYQIFNLSITAYETIKIFPRKKEFSLNVINFKIENNLKLNLILVLCSTFITLTMMSFYNYLNIVFILCIVMLMLRSFVYNILSMRMEILFWSSDFSKMIISLTILNILFLTIATVNHFFHIDTSGLILIISSTTSFIILNQLLKSYKR